MAAIVAGISLLVPTAPPAAGAAATAPDFTIQVLGANGSGCPVDSPSSVTAEVLTGGAIILRYRDFMVAGGDYKTCVVVVNVVAPEGWTYAIPSIENVAWVEIQAGASAKLATNAWFTGFDWTVSDSKRVEGPLVNYWETISAPATPQWAPCNESFNLSVAETTRVSGAASNNVTLVSTTILRPRWREC